MRMIPGAPPGVQPAATEDVPEIERIETARPVADQILLTMSVIA